MPAGFERAVARMRAAAEALGATQFEALTAAALARVRRARRRRRRSSRPASAAGSTRRTSSTRAVVVLTNVALEHTDVLGDTREEIAGRSSRSCACGESRVSIGQRAFDELVARRSAESSTGGSPRAGRAKRSSAGASSATCSVQLPGPARAPRRRDLGRRPQPEAVAGSSRALPVHDVRVVVVDPRRQGRRRACSRARRAGARFVATTSRNPRALPAEELAARAAAHFEHVRGGRRIRVARSRARARARDAVLVTGSLYLLADSHRPSEARSKISKLGERLSVFASRPSSSCDRRARVRRRVRRRSTSPLTGRET